MASGEQQHLSECEIAKRHAHGRRQRGMFLLHFQYYPFALYRYCLYSLCTITNRVKVP